MKYVVKTEFREWERRRKKSAMAQAQFYAMHSVSPIITVSRRKYGMPDEVIETFHAHDAAAPSASGETGGQAVSEEMPFDPDDYPVI